MAIGGPQLFASLEDDRIFHTPDFRKLLCGLIDEFEYLQVPHLMRYLSRFFLCVRSSYFVQERAGACKGNIERKTKVVAASFDRYLGVLDRFNDETFQCSQGKESTLQGIIHIEVDNVNYPTVVCLY